MPTLAIDHVVLSHSTVFDSFCEAAHHHCHLHLSCRLMLLAHNQHNRSKRLRVRPCIPVELQAVRADCNDQPPAIVHLVEPVDMQRNVHLHLCCKLLQPVHKLPASQVNLLYTCFVAFHSSVD